MRFHCTIPYRARVGGGLKKALNTLRPYMIKRWSLKKNCTTCFNMRNSMNAENIDIIVDFPLYLELRGQKPSIM